MDTPEDVFKHIVSSSPRDLEQRVLAVLREHVGKKKRISRQALVQRVFGKTIARGALANSTEDRQVRVALEALQYQHPILSSSGTGGYYYAESAEEIARYAAELDSRAKKLQQKSIRLARLAARYEHRDRRAQ